MVFSTKKNTPATKNSETPLDPNGAMGGQQVRRDIAAQHFQPTRTRAPAHKVKPPTKTVEYFYSSAEAVIFACMRVILLGTLSD